MTLAQETKDQFLRREYRAAVEKALTRLRDATDKFHRELAGGLVPSDLATHRVADAYEDLVDATSWLNVFEYPTR